MNLNVRDYNKYRLNLLIKSNFEIIYIFKFRYRLVVRDIFNI